MDGLWNQSICLSVLSTPQKGVEKKSENFAFGRYRPFIERQRTFRLTHFSCLRIYHLKSLQKISEKLMSLFFEIEPCLPLLPLYS